MQRTRRAAGLHHRAALYCYRPLSGHPATYPWWIAGRPRNLPECLALTACRLPHRHRHRSAQPLPHFLRLAIAQGGLNPIDRASSESSQCPSWVAAASISRNDQSENWTLARHKKASWASRNQSANHQEGSHWIAKWRRPPGLRRYLHYGTNFAR